MESDDWARIHNDMVSAFHSESDRGAALCSMGFFESLMKGLLGGVLVKDPKVTSQVERLPLAGLITLAHGLGLTSKVVHEDLLILLSVRNAFAHHPFSLTFDEPGIAKATGKLSTARYYRVGSLSGELRRHENPRERFLIAVTQAIQQILRVRGGLNRREIPPTVTIYRWNARGESA